MDWKNEICSISQSPEAETLRGQKEFINSISINTEQLAKGIYLYEVRNKNGVIKKGKVVKD